MHNSRELISWTIRKKLLLLLMVLFVPASGIIVASSLEQRKHEISAAGNNALLLVQSLSAQQEQITIEIRQMLTTLALLPAVQRLDAQACNELFHQLNNLYPCYSVLAAATPDGNMFASSTPFESCSVNLSDRKHIKDAISTLDFSVGEYIVGRVSKVRSINYTYPVLDADRNLISILIAGFKLDEYDFFIRKVNLPEGSTVTITDHKGARLYYLSEKDAAVLGKSIPRDVIEWISGDLDHGTFDRTGEDGMDRIHAFKQLRLREGSPPYLYMLAGIPKDKILHRANLAMLSNLAILGFAAFTAMSLAWVFGSFALVKPISQLVTATRRFGSGEMGTRTDIPHTHDELGQLAKSFDDMASLLEVRDLARKNAEDALQQAHDSLEQRVQERTEELAASNKQLNREIEERKQMEKVLEESEKRFQDILNRAPSAIYVKNKQGRYTFVNRHFERLSGYRSEEILGRTDFELFPQDVARQSTENDRKALDMEAPLEIEEIAPVAGEMHTFISAKFPVYDLRGAPYAICGVSTDINERKQAERNSQNMLRFMQTLMDTIPNPIFYKDDKGIYLGCNKAFEVHLGLSKEDIIGKTVFDIAPADLAHRYHAMDSALFRQPGKQTYESQMLYADNSRHDVIFNKATFSNSDGSPAGLVGVMIDITERKKAEQALRKSEEHYRLVFENAPLGIIHFDKTSRVTNCNDKFADIIGASKEKIIGFNLILQLRDERFRDAVITALGGKAGYFEGDYISVCGDKPSRLMALFQRINSEDGEFMGAVGIFEDITERKLAEMEKERLIGELQDALSKVKLLSGLLPICASCKKIRDDKGYWQQIEEYIRGHSEAEFSHSICPECARKLYSAFYKEESDS